MDLKHLLYIYIYIYNFLMLGEVWLGFPDLWSGQKPWKNWYLTPVVNFGAVRRAQLVKSTHLTSWPCDLFRSFKVYSNAKERVGVRKSTGSYRTYSSLVELQSWFLSLRWKTCLRQKCSLGSCDCGEGPGQNSLMIIFNKVIWTIS